MAVAAPARKTAPAPAPSRTSPPPKTSPARKRPLRPTRSRIAAAPATAPARKPARKAPARKAPARKPATRKAAAAPARKAPARRAAPRKTAPRKASAAQRAVAGGQLIPIAVGRTAVAVSQLPDSGLVVRLTRGRAWIAVLGMLLVGIVALNVVTLSFAASAGQIDEQITALDQENSILRGRDAQRSGIGAVRNAAVPLGLAMPSSEDVHFSDVDGDDVATAAARLAVAGP